MTTGIVASGRAAALGSGTTLGIGAELGIGRAVGNDTAVGKGGITDGNGSTLATSTARVGAATAGSGATDGSAGGFGACGVGVQATEATSAKTTSGRMSNLPTSERSKSFASRPGAQRKQVVVAVQGARAGLTGRERST